MRRISKEYVPGVLANDEVDLLVEQGSVHAVLGENGAGKTTLMKILYGMEQPTRGEMLIHGTERQFPSPTEAIAAGIGMVHQNFMLVPSFTLAENIVLGYEPKHRGRIDAEEMVRRADALSEEFGLSVDSTAPAEAAPIGMRQRAEILKALHRGADVLILDEPTSVLTPQEVEGLYEAIRQLRDAGKSVIIITHKLREVKAIADELTVLRAGRQVGTVKASEVSEQEIARMMVGRDAFLSVDRPRISNGDPILEIRDLTVLDELERPGLSDLSFVARGGEILGIAGVEGNGQTELARVITGLASPVSGEVLLNGENLKGMTPRSARSMGIAHIPEDRIRDGLSAAATVGSNLIVDRYHREPFAKRFVLQSGAIAEYGQQLVEDYDIRPGRLDDLAGSLSGGNAQKVVAAREISAATAVLVAAHPTRGVDIGASEQIWEKLIDLKEQGKAIILISADLNEILELSDRIGVLFGGTLVGAFLNNDDLTQAELGFHMIGVKRQGAAAVDAIVGRSWG